MASEEGLRAGENHRTVEEARLSESTPDDIRAKGWMVAVHNDYKQNGERFTFWLFSKDTTLVKGEGRTDAEALNQIRKKLDNQVTKGTKPDKEGPKEG